ncbi:hypothetical protein [Microvirga sp. VF16]|uniref:hypothetical protein n=1 Tax=Microvirga sp. VF16 TaxID=2807101 RepID=UPI00193EB041|nr:hypothetical protein [Microvirga sp. VF16]QRM32477.1 hypothetical protein JO965_30755 [Microvirga sp. VF16]
MTDDTKNTGGTSAQSSQQTTQAAQVSAYMKAILARLNPDSSTPPSDGQSPSRRA